MSGWALSEASARCLWRRALAGLRAAPVPVALGLVALAATPWLMVRAGSALGEAMTPALADARATRVLAATIVALAALGGATVSLGLPSREALGAELAGAPLTDRRLLWSTWLAPLVLVLAAAAPPLLGLLLSLAASSPAGWAAAPALVVAGLAGALLGAAVAEVGRLSLRRDVAGAFGAAVLVVCWLTAGALSGASALGPLDLFGRSLGGGDAPAGALVGLFMCGGAAAVWTVCVTRERRSRASRVPRVVVPAWRARPLIAVGSVLVLLTRRRSVRTALALAVVAGAGTLCFGRVGGAPWSVAALLAIVTAVLATAPLPLTAAGALIDGRWLWQTVPVRSVTIAGSWTVSAVGSLVLVGVTIALPAVALLGLERSSFGPIVLGSVLVGACGLLAGALVPFREGTMGDQVPSISALVVILATGGVLAGETGAALTEIGASDAIAGITPVVVAVLVAWLAVAIRAARVA